ncbi:LysR family transcriptional regulator [Acinetobacter nosocomialis]|uniref:LysR family transcriptional regulator n=1 Tax=Acinetobacter nosocomialis TaxID=106654 RepID=UPI002F40FFE3
MKSTIEELVAFIAIVDTGSFVAAADHLKQTPSGVSRSLTRLEAKLDVTLLERTTRKLKLTQEGQQFLVKARKILNELNAAEEELQKSDQDTSGLIRIDSATPFVLHVVAPLMHAFRKRYPHIEIELNSNDQVIDLLQHKTDVAFRFGELNDSSMRAKLVCKSRLYMVASPEYLNRAGYPQHPQELNEHELIGFTKPAHLNTWPLKIGIDYFVAQPHIKASNGETVRQLALRGHGITCLSEFMVWKDLEEGRLVALFEDQIELQLQSIHAVYYQQEHLPKRIRLFIEFLAEQLQDGFKTCL